MRSLQGRFLAIAGLLLSIGTYTMPAAQRLMRSLASSGIQRYMAMPIHKASYSSLYSRFLPSLSHLGAQNSQRQSKNRTRLWSMATASARAFTVASQNTAPPLLTANAPTGFVRHVLEHIEQADTNTIKLIIRYYPHATRQLVEAASTKITQMPLEIVTQLASICPEAHITLFDVACQQVTTIDFSLLRELSDMSDTYLDSRYPGAEAMERARSRPSNWNFRKKMSKAIANNFEKFIGMPDYERKIWWAWNDLTRQQKVIVAHTVTAQNDIITKPFFEKLIDDAECISILKPALLTAADKLSHEQLRTVLQTKPEYAVDFAQHFHLFDENFVEQALKDDSLCSKATLMVKLLNEREKSRFKAHLEAHKEKLANQYQSVFRKPIDVMTLARNRSTLFRLQELYDRCNITWNAATIKPPTLKKIMTPSIAQLLMSSAAEYTVITPYLNNPTLRKIALQANAIEEIAQKQNETYYSYVHAQHWSLDMVQKTYEVLHPQTTNCFFPLHFLTITEHPIDPANEKSLVSSLLKDGSCPEANGERHLLSMNASFWGNMNDPGACTADYFRSNNSVYPPQHPFRRLLKSGGHEDLYDKYEDEICHVQSLHTAASQYGKLWVILIPKKVHRQLVIPTRPGGRKITVTIAGKKNDDVDLIQDTLCKEPHLINNASTLQFRLLMTPSTGLNPETGIKTIPLHAADPEKYAAFEQAFTILMDKIKADIAAKQKPVISADESSDKMTGLYS